VNVVNFASFRVSYLLDTHRHAARI